MKRAETPEERNKRARAAELEGDLELAIELYEQNVKEAFADEYSYNRLMVIYRRQKAYKDEMRIIKKGVQVFKELAKNQLKDNISSRKNKNQLVKLSNAFMKGAGLIDKKGNDTYFPEPINRWMKRLEVTTKKIKPK